MKSRVTLLESENSRQRKEYEELRISKHPQENFYENEIRKQKGKYDDLHTELISVRRV